MWFHQGLGTLLLTSYQTGSLTTKLSDNPQKVNGLAGATLGAILQSASTVLLGTIIGIAFFWRVGLISVACVPLLVCCGYIRLVGASLSIYLCA